MLRTLNPQSQFLTKEFSQQPDACARLDYYVFDPHQRCGYSDSPFARILFYTAGSGNGLEGVDGNSVNTEKGLSRTQTKEK